MDFTMVMWFCNGVFIGLLCLTTYNTCSVVYNCYQYISNSIVTYHQYRQDDISWAKYVLDKQYEINMSNYLTGKEEMCNEFLHNMDVVSVAERSDDRRSSTTNVSGDKVTLNPLWSEKLRFSSGFPVASPTGDVLRISTHILRDNVGVQRNMMIEYPKKEKYFLQL